MLLLSTILQLKVLIVCHLTGLYTRVKVLLVVTGNYTRWFIVYQPSCLVNGSILLPKAIALHTVEVAKDIFVATSCV